MICYRHVETPLDTLRQFVMYVLCDTCFAHLWSLLIPCDSVMFPIPCDYMQFHVHVLSCGPFRDCFFGVLVHESEISFLYSYLLLNWSNARCSFVSVNYYKLILSLIDFWEMFFCSLLLTQNIWYLVGIADFETQSPIYPRWTLTYRRSKQIYYLLFIKSDAEWRIQRQNTLFVPLSPCKIFMFLIKALDHMKFQIYHSPFPTYSILWRQY